MEAIAEILWFALWLILLVILAVFGLPVILVWTRFDGSAPYWGTVWRRYGTLLKGCLEAI